MSVSYSDFFYSSIDFISNKAACYGFNYYYASKALAGSLHDHLRDLEDLCRQEANAWENDELAVVKNTLADESMEIV